MRNIIRRDILSVGMVVGILGVVGALSPSNKALAASVVLTQAQIDAIVAHFSQVYHVQPNATAIVSTTDLSSAIKTLAMSISIGGGSVSYAPAFSPPVSNMTASQQAALICYMIQTAMGVPLIG
jgi:hypothetical protein